MAEYRTTKNKRVFYKLTDTGHIITVYNGYAKSSVISELAAWKKQEVFEDPYNEYVPCTEEEFNTAKSIAMTRLSLERIE